MRNFSSATAISRALHSTLIENLKETMKATRKILPKTTQDKFPTLYDIINPQSNHRGYYEALHAATSSATVPESNRDSCIPWLDIHLKDLDRVVRQPLTVQVDRQHLVDFGRYNRFMDRTKKILHYSPPDLESQRHEGQLAYLLDQLRDVDHSGGLEQRLLEKSQALSIQESSPKGRNEENLRRVGISFC